MGQQAVLWFRELSRHDIPIAGGKGANLGELTQAGIPVPPGFVVTVDSYERFIEASGLRDKIAAALAGVDHNDSRALQQASDNLKQLIINEEVPAAIAHAIRAAYRELGEGPVAVRSSATAEDLPDASFAGQQDTFLNIEGADQVVHAVKACWASLFEARAIFYRVENNFDHASVAIAVPVQKMVQSERSGVMFTAEPVSSDTTKIAIEAVRGLGEAIVSGQVTPDLYIVDKADLRILERTVADQPKEMVKGEASAAALDGTVWRDIPAAERKQPKLSDDQVVELARIALVVEAHYGVPQDIEWAAEAGRFFILQTRPVTTIKTNGSARPSEDLVETAPFLLEGSPASPGVAAGPVRIVLDPSEIDRVQPGDILVAEMTTPDYVPAMKRAVAIVTDRGGRTAHAAIVSRELGIPCVVGAERATATLSPGQLITVDGSHGKVYEGRADASLSWASREKARHSVGSTIKTRTSIYVNLAEPELAEVVAKRNVDGVGLLRAEFVVAQIGEHPRLAIDEGRGEHFTQQLADGLRQFAKAFHPRPVIYRTTDFKTNEYHNLRGGDRYEKHEENPMIGFRGASRYIREPEVFRLEIDAIKRVRKDYDNFWVMIPFCRTPEELSAVKMLLGQFGLRQSDTFKLWMMAEVPSNVLLLDQFLNVGLDGISIGSNDLTQLVLGIDRDSERLANEFDERHPAVMRALETLITGAKARSVTVSICGQAPSVYPELTEKLVAWGITSVSVSPDAIDVTREIVAAAEAKLAVLSN